MLGFFVLLGVVYSARLARAGRASFERVERTGSAIFGKGVMEMTYWGLQPLARWMVRRGITPDALSWTSLFAGIGAGVSIGWGCFGLAGLCAMLSGFLDLFDGLVARATDRCSDAGEVLDAAIDRYAEFFFYGGLILYYSSYPAMELIVILALAGSSMITYSSAKAEALGVDAPSALMRRHERTALLVIGASLSGFSVPLLENHSAGVPLGVPMVVVLSLIAVVGNLAAVRRLHGIAGATRNRIA